MAESLAVFALVSSTYFAIYRIRNKKFERREAERMAALKAEGAIPNEKEEKEKEKERVR
jgi:hypothetical protein